MSELSRTTLRAVMAVDPAIGFTTDDPDPAFAFIPAGDGEIQVSQDGQAWWFRWDRTGGVADERELELPDSQDPSVLASWMAEQARQFDEPTVWPDAGFGGQDITYELVDEAEPQQFV